MYWALFFCLFFVDFFFLALQICVLTLSCVQLFATLWAVAHQASLSMGFPRQEYGNGLPFPSPGDRPNPGIKPTFLGIGRWIFLPLATREAPNSKT